VTVEEADEGATSKEAALRNLGDQVRRGEGPAVVDMYERAAWGAGATVASIQVSAAP